jgi:hypothetical protein
MGNEINDEVSNSIKTKVLKLERYSFGFCILSIVIGYAGITLWLNAIRATAAHWFVWVLIVIQFTLYFSIFIVSFRRSKVFGINNYLGICLFTVLAILGRVNNWELVIIPLLAATMLVLSARNNKVSEKRKPWLLENSTS